MKYSHGYRGWQRRCDGRAGQECPNHPGVRIGFTRVCPIDHLEAMAAAGDGPNARTARARLEAAGWAV